MKTSRLFLALIFIGLISPHVLACSCAMEERFKIKKDLNNYTFIARVKITSIDSVAGFTNKRLSYHRIGFDVIEHFKGELLSSMLVSGGHRALSLRYSSCSLEESIGEEWIIFANEDSSMKQIRVSKCSRSYRYINTEGYANRRWDDQRKLELLRKLFKKPVEEVHPEGMYMETYPNGQQSLEATYCNGKLEGQRLLWYPNGILESKQQFKAGKKDGIFTWYYDNGQLSSREKYYENHFIDTTTYWSKIDTTSGVAMQASLYNLSPDSVRKIKSSFRVSAQHIYNAKGQLLSSRYYSWDGSLDNLYLYDYKKDEILIQFFHKNGTLSSEQHAYIKEYKSFGVYQAWNDKGELVKSWRYDKKGEMIKESFKQYSK